MVHKALAEAEEIAGEVMDKMYEAAKKIATDAHEGQTRWGGEPYITHPNAVANIVRYLVVERDGNRDRVDLFMTVAMLHDTVEDTEVTLDDLMDTFPKIVVDAVNALTKRDGESYLDSILRVNKNPVARLVKIADITHNLMDLKKGSLRDKYLLARYILGGHDG